MDVARGGSSTDRSAWSNAATQGWECKPISDEGCSRPRIEYGERVTRLRSGDPANCPVAKGLVGEAGPLGEEWQIVAIADGQAMRPNYAVTVKSPAESKGKFDYYKVGATIPPEQAYRPLSEGGCPLVKAAK